MTDIKLTIPDDWADTIYEQIKERSLSDRRAPANHWVLCSDRVPEKGEEVLVTIEGEVAIAWRAQYGDHWNSCEIPTSYMEEHPPKAWMPLPKPYKGA